MFGGSDAERLLAASEQPLDVAPIPITPPACEARSLEVNPLVRLKGGGLLALIPEGEAECNTGLAQFVSEVAITANMDFLCRAALVRDQPDASEQVHRQRAIGRRGVDRQVGAFRQGDLRVDRAS